MASVVSGTQLPAVARTTVGGLPVWSAPGFGPARLALVVRAGRADETLPTAGVSRLVAELARLAAGDRGHRTAVTVDAHRTVISAEGTPEECLAFGRDVAARFVNLPYNRLIEARAVVAELPAAVAGGLGELIDVRCGAEGFGLIAYPEHGAARLDAVTVDRWREARFNAANTGVVVSGIDPLDVAVRLPGGSWAGRLPAAPAGPVLPGWFSPRHDRGFFGLSLIVPRSAAADVAVRVLAQRFFERLRRDLALVCRTDIGTAVYDPWHQHVVVTAEPLPGRAAEARIQMERELDSLGRLGPGVAEIDLAQLAARRAWEDPRTATALAADLLFDELSGAAPRTPATVHAATQSVLGPEVKAVFREAARTVLWALPGDAVPVGGPGRCVDPWRAAEPAARGRWRRRPAATT